jgi:hypothetical protein
VLKNLKVVHRNKQFIHEVFDILCWLLATYCSTEEYAVRAIQHHGILDTLYIYLPNSSSNLREHGADPVAFENLYTSFFELIANLSSSYLGIMGVISRGFLRVTLDKLAMLYKLYDIEDVEYWNEAKVMGRPSVPPSPLRMQITACLRVINRCANYNSGSIGNANDLILGDNYRVIAFCVDIVRVPECPRQDLAYIEVS